LTEQPADVRDETHVIVKFYGREIRVRCSVSPLSRSASPSADSIRNSPGGINRRLIPIELFTVTSVFKWSAAALVAVQNHDGTSTFDREAGEGADLAESSVGVEGAPIPPDRTACGGDESTSAGASNGRRPVSRK